MIKYLYTGDTLRIETQSNARLILISQAINESVEIVIPMGGNWELSQVRIEPVYSKFQQLIKRIFRI